MDSKFKILFENAPSLLLVLGPKLDIVAVSESYLKATMTQRSSIVGRHLFEVFPDNPDDPQASGTNNLRASLLRVLQLKKPDGMAIQKYDIRRPEAEGGGFEERHWSPINTPILNSDGEVIFIVHKVEDVTEFVRLKREGVELHKASEEQRNRADQLEKLRQAQRMEAMGQLAGGVAHDFNNMLAVILIICENTLDAPELTTHLRKKIMQIKSTSEKAAELTRQLLSFSRKQVLQPKAINLNSVVRDLHSMLARLLREDISLQMNLAEELEHTLADHTQLEQVILNLVVNARDALPKGGTITIGTSNVILDELIELNPRVVSGRYVMLSVSDTGIGMDAKTQARLFEPFFTTKGVGQGTGLGLATVYGIVSQNKGGIWVYSELNQGTTFRIYLPWIESQESSIHEEIEAPALLASTAAKILIVEDQDELRELIGETLRDQGYEIFEASNGVEALRLVKENPQKFDVVVTDVVMPEMGGPALATELAKIQPDYKVLFLSGYTENVLVRDGVGVKQLHFLEKPFSRSNLLLKIQEILKGQ